MEQDKFIIYATCGAVFLSAVYHTFFYLKRKENLLLKYSLYLWSSLLAQLAGASIIANNVNNINYILLNVAVFSSYYFYLRFVEAAFSIFKSSNKLHWLFLQLLYGLIWALMSVILISDIFFTRYNAVADILFGFFGFTICIFGFYFSIYYFKRSKTNFIRLMAFGTFCLSFFNVYYIVFSISNGHNNLVENFSIGSAACFAEVMVYTIALAIKTNDELRGKVEAMQKLNEFQQVLLNAELEKQDLLYVGRQNERMRISREMHDELSNALVGLKYYISDIKTNERNEVQKNIFKKIEQEVQYVYIEARNYMHRLHSAHYEHSYDLVAFLLNIQKRFAESSLCISVTADYTMLNTKLSVQEKNAVYFLVKEALTNTMKYANASQVTINCYIENDHFLATISDNGVGLGAGKTEGIGIKNMHERINSFGGSISVTGDASGTTISFKFPIKLPLTLDVSRF